MEVVIIQKQNRVFVRHNRIVSVYPCACVGQRVVVDVPFEICNSSRLAGKLTVEVLFEGEKRNYILG